MGDILSKLQMVCKTLNVNEEAHTIEDQLDILVRTFGKIPESTNIAESLDDLSEVGYFIPLQAVDFSVYSLLPDGTVDIFCSADSGVVRDLINDPEFTLPKTLMIGAYRIADEEFSDCPSLKRVIISPGLAGGIGVNAFADSGVETIFIPFPKGGISGAPWGAYNAMICWSDAVDYPNSYPEPEPDPDDGDVEI